MNRLKAGALFLSGVLAALLFCGWLVIGHANDDAEAIVRARQDGYEAAERERLAIIADRPVAEGNYVPFWLQTDPQWSHVPYAGGTVGDSGCGLVCAAMALESMTLQGITPLQLADFVGDECLTGGVNDPGKFCAWIESHYPEYRIESSEIYYETERALSDVEDGWLVFAGMSGALGDAEYEGHVVMIWRADDEGYWVRDPDSGANSSRPFSSEELSAVDFKYFYSIRGGLYGAQRH